MKKITLYTLLGLATVCAVTGIALLLISLIGSKAIKNGLYITNSYDITEAFENIEIDTRECTVYFSKSYDGKIKAVLHENEKALHKVYVDDNTLKIEKADGLRFLTFSAGIGQKNAAITVYLPENTYKNLSINTDSGGIDIMGSYSFSSVKTKSNSGTISITSKIGDTLSATTDSGEISVSALASHHVSLESLSGAIKLSASVIKTGIEAKTSSGKITIRDVETELVSCESESGEISIENMPCNSIYVSAKSAKTELENVTATGGIDIDSKSGSVHLTFCDAAEVNVNTISGNVYGQLLSDMTYNVKSKSGTISVPTGIFNKTCTVTTSSGDVKFS